MVGNSNDNTNFPHKLLLTDRQVANIRKAFSNNLSRDVKFLPILLGTLGASLLGNLLTGGKGVIRAGDGIKKKFKFTNTISPINQF